MKRDDSLLKWAILLWDVCRMEEYLVILGAFREEVRRDAEKEFARVEGCASESGDPRFIELLQEDGEI